MFQRRLNEASSESYSAHRNTLYEEYTGGLAAHFGSNFL
jgi:hypothetical protein